MHSRIMTLQHRMLAQAAALAAVSVIAAAQSSRTDAPAPPAFVIPLWAFPSTSPPYVTPKPPFDSIQRLQLKHSRESFSRAQVMDRFAPPDWFPATHPPAPTVVARGRRPSVLACGYCHLLDGRGRPENAVLAGLPVEYFMRQVADMRSGARRSAVADWLPWVNMHATALSATDSEASVAAHYFARIRATRRYRVVERSQIPHTYQALGLYARTGEKGTEPLGTRIIEIADDIERHDLRDARETFTAYVPRGSIARGKRIATVVGGNPVVACATCHGPTLRGAGAIPPLAGRSPSYLLRQLIAFRTGARAAETSAPMQVVVSHLGLDDMIAAVAYAGSLCGLKPNDATRGERVLLIPQSFISYRDAGTR